MGEKGDHSSQQEKYFKDMNYKQTDSGNTCPQQVE